MKHNDDERPRYTLRDPDCALGLLLDYYPGGFNTDAKPLEGDDGANYSMVGPTAEITSEVADAFHKCKLYNAMHVYLQTGLICLPTEWLQPLSGDEGPTLERAAA